MKPWTISSSCLVSWSLIPITVWFLIREYWHLLQKLHVFHIIPKQLKNFQKIPLHPIFSVEVASIQSTYYLLDSLFKLDCCKFHVLINFQGIISQNILKHGHILQTSNSVQLIGNSLSIICKTIFTYQLWTKN